MTEEKQLHISITNIKYVTTKVSHQDNRIFNLC